METWAVHHYVVPEQNVTVESLNELMARAMVFPDTRGPADFQQVVDESNRLRGWSDVILTWVNINGVPLRMTVVFVREEDSTPPGYLSIKLVHFHDVMKDHPGRDERLQSVLRWIFVETNALYMAAWGQDDEKSRPRPEDSTVESMNRFPSAYYMLSKDLVRHVGGERVAALGPSADIDDAGMWLMFRDDYYWPVDEETNAQKNPILDEIWAKWKASRS